MRTVHVDSDALTDECILAWADMNAGLVQTYARRQLGSGVYNIDVAVEWFQYAVENSTNACRKFINWIRANYKDEIEEYYSCNWR